MAHIRRARGSGLPPRRLHTSSEMVENGARILVVDDDAGIGRVLQVYLEGLGHAVSVAVSAADGRRMIEELSPDLLIIDVMMPKEDGITATRRIRAQVPDLPILVMTAYGHQTRREAAIAAGASSVLEKPFDMRELAVEISTLLAG